MRVVAVIRSRPRTHDKIVSLRSWQSRWGGGCGVGCASGMLSLAARPLRTLQCRHEEQHGNFVKHLRRGGGGRGCRRRGRGAAPRAGRARRRRAGGARAPRRAGLFRADGARPGRWMSAANGCTAPSRNPWTEIARELRFAIDETLPNWGARVSLAFRRGGAERLVRGARGVRRALRARRRGAARSRRSPNCWSRADAGTALIGAISTWANGTELERVSVKDHARYENDQMNWRVLKGYGTLISDLWRGAAGELRHGRRAHRPSRPHHRARDEPRRRVGARGHRHDPDQPPGARGDPVHAGAARQDRGRGGPAARHRQQALSRDRGRRATICRATGI